MSYNIRVDHESIVRKIKADLDYLYRGIIEEEVEIAIQNVRKRILAITNKRLLQVDLVKDFPTMSDNLHVHLDLRMGE